MLPFILLDAAVYIDQNGLGGVLLGILNEVEENVYRAMDDTGLAVIRVEFEPYGMTVTLEQMETEDYYDFCYLEGYYRKTEELNWDEVG